MASKRIIGRVEQVTFPVLKLYDVDAKIDTGAYSSSIHCENIQEINGQLYCWFVAPMFESKGLVFESYNKVEVRSSNGQKEQRYKITTTICLGEQSYPIALTLANRGKMRYPVLIGRKFLKKRFLVDVSFTNKIKNTDEK